MINVDHASGPLDTHLAAVKRFEETEQMDKVLEHLDSFQKILDHQRDEELISDGAYDSLMRDASYLIEKTL